MAELDVLALAREHCDGGTGNSFNCMSVPALKRFTAAILEEAAKVCEDLIISVGPRDELGRGGNEALKQAAAAIRAMTPRAADPADGG